ncbi:tRNA (guanine(37)-N1)-methyltransferase-like [Pollicipes pollicipes]|uniref:tRNA (guanine(37)-N1)-methyltransferase-like n=1 Tax=Pollicipes pollicipes TaxID=41117 RepID=UPI0018853CF0|nr:tRNA (guanine(37)-N1)-methyltransferase-like [Pollicipes pollicipes]
MADSPLLPPAAVRGMTLLDRAAFRRPLDVCALRVPRDSITAVCRLVKAQMLREAGGDAAQKVVLLDPGQVKDEDDLPWPGLRQLGLEPAASFCRLPLALTYENYRADAVLRAVLPGDQDGCTSFSRVGHLIHLNLKEHLLPYGRLIGAVLMDKHSGVRTVVNKLNTIDNTFRNFSMELLAGEPDYVVDARENGCGFRMDFSQVYWNPRLCTEHERVVALLRRGDTLLDVFAGVGPFAVPAARKGCHVLANDLNPESARWLRHNVQANKVAERVQTFNMDGREFIRTEVKRAALEFLTEKPGQAQMHAVLNLPALAIEFVDAFLGLLSPEELPEGSHLPLRAHVYTFTKELEVAEQSVRAMLNANLGRDVAEHVQEVFMVRNVAPNKLMYRITWDVPREVLCAVATEPARKRPKIDE